MTELSRESMSREKHPLLIIGHIANPRGFEGDRLPAEYYFNSKTWVKSKLINDIMNRFDLKMWLRNCNGLLQLFVDNCPAYPNTHLENIKLQFFPPIVPSKGQPLNQGIIANFKTHYKNEIQLRTVRAPNVGVRQSKLALCECLFVASNAWSNTVEASTIQHCFRKAGFKLPNKEIEKIFDNSVDKKL